MPWSRQRPSREEFRSVRCGPCAQPGPYLGLPPFFSSLGRFSYGLSLPSVYRVVYSKQTPCFCGRKVGRKVVRRGDLAADCRSASYSSAGGTCSSTAGHSAVLESQLLLFHHLFSLTLCLFRFRAGGFHLHFVSTFSAGLAYLLPHCHLHLLGAGISPSPLHFSFTSPFLLSISPSPVTNRSFIFKKLNFLREGLVM